MKTKKSKKVETHVTQKVKVLKVYLVGQIKKAVSMLISYAGGVRAAMLTATEQPTGAEQQQQPCEAHVNNKRQYVGCCCLVLRYPAYCLYVSI